VGDGVVDGGAALVKLVAAVFGGGEGVVDLAVEGEGVAAGLEGVEAGEVVGDVLAEEEKGGGDAFASEELGELGGEGAGAVVEGEEDVARRHGRRAAER